MLSAQRVSALVRWTGRTNAADVLYFRNLHIADTGY